MLRRNVKKARGFDVEAGEQDEHEGRRNRQSQKVSWFHRPSGFAR
jgi:hypothetical protein